MKREALLHPDVVDAAAEASFGAARLAAGELATRPWVMLLPGTRAILRRMVCTALNAAWDAAEAMAKAETQTQAQAPKAD